MWAVVLFSWLDDHGVLTLILQKNFSISLILLCFLLLILPLYCNPFPARQLITLFLISGVYTPSLPFHTPLSSLSYLQHREFYSNNVWRNVMRDMRLGPMYATWRNSEGELGGHAR